MLVAVVDSGDTTTYTLIPTRYVFTSCTYTGERHWCCDGGQGR